MRVIVAGLCLASAAHIRAAPYIAYRGVVNAASFAPAGLPNGKLARGSVISIFGKELGPASGQQVTSFPLGTTLAGVSLSFSQGSTVSSGVPLYVSAAQINAILPSNSPLGRVTLRVTYNGQESNAGYIEVAATGFGIYSVYAGAGPGIFQNFVAGDNQPINTLVESAKPGQVVTLWGTGLGAAPSDSVAPAAGDLPGTVEVFVGGKLARKLYSGRSPCCAGSDQVIFEVPADSPTGCYLPVTVRVNGVPSNTTTMAVMPEGGACRDAHNPFGNLSETATETRREGWFLGAVAQDTDPAGQIQMGLMAKFEEQSGVFRFHPLEALPPLDTCTVYAGKANLAAQNFLPSLAGGSKVLESAATLALDTLSLIKPDEAKPYYFLQAAAGRAGLTYGVRPQASRLSSATSAEVGSVSGTVNKVDLPSGANLNSLRVVQRSTPLEVRWNPSAGGLPIVVVLGGASISASNSSAVFLCVARASTGTFTVPAHVLGSLPAAGADLNGRGLLAVGQVASPGDLAASGVLKALTLFTA